MFLVIVILCFSRFTKVNFSFPWKNSAYAHGLNWIFKKTDMLFLFSPEPQTNIRSIILRDDTDAEEHIEIRRVFVHPKFTFPQLYNDIAIGELGNCFSTI